MPAPPTPPEKYEEKSRFGLSAPQVIASGLTAVIATVAGSYLGISGTVIGAAVASVLTVVGNAVFGHSLRRTGAAVRTLVPVASTRALSPPPPAEPIRPSIADEPVWSPATHTVGRATNEIKGPRPIKAAPADPWWRQINYRRAAVAVVAVFALLMTGVAAVEVVAQRSLSSVVRGESGSGSNYVTPTTVTVTVTPSATASTEAGTSTSSAATPTSSATTSAAASTTSAAATTAAPTATASPTPSATATPTPVTTATPSPTVNAAAS